ncbi:MAG TPA: toprim domain-containing protein, partial [Stellaceae bacterium]|nr:toprim domain-containing protein [Stellaceae bacterium]
MADINRNARPTSSESAPPALSRLYIARDNDAAGLRAAERLRERGIAAGIEIRELVP